MLSNHFPSLDPEYLPVVSHVLGRSIEDLLTDDSLSITETQLNTIYTLIQKIRHGMPLPYVIQGKAFFKDDFYVTRDVLIPRSETEYLVEASLRFIEKHFKAQPCNIFDICTGSGCVGLSIAKYVSGTPTLVLTDISDKALEVTRINARTLLPDSSNVHILKSDLLKNIPWEKGCNINILVSNPPYIPSSRIPLLDKSVRDYEPHLALDGGERGFECALELLREAKDHLAKTYLILIELDDKQEEHFTQQVQELYPTSAISYEKDLYGVTRYLRIESIPS